MGYLKTVQDRMRSNREIASLDEGVLADLGITRRGLRRLSSAPPLVMRRLMAMSARQKVDQQALSADLQNLSELVERCRGCKETRACSSFLADPAIDAEKATFCRNLADFRQLPQSRYDAPAAARFTQQH